MIVSANQNFLTQTAADIGDYKIVSIKQECPSAFCTYHTVAIFF